MVDALGEGEETNGPPWADISEGLAELALFDRRAFEESMEELGLLLIRVRSARTVVINNHE